MKRFIAEVVVCITVCLAGIWWFGDNGVKAAPRPRFELILEQYHEPGDHSFEVFHDKETGQELVCVYGGMDVASCYLTGRVWK